MRFIIDNPKKEDIKEIEQLFHTVLVDTFNINAIPEAYEGEIECLVKRNTSNVIQAFSSKNSQEYFLIARNDKDIVGIMGFGKPSKEIRKNYKINFENIPEIKNAFILPSFQRLGIGTQLFENLKRVLEKKRR